MEFVPTPCQQRCSSDSPDGICPGCNRTNEEVRDWNGYTNERKAEVIKLIELRSFTCSKK